MNNAKGESSVVNFVEEKREVVASTKWLIMKKIHYKDAKGIQRVWDTVERTTRTAEVDGVEIIAIVHSKTEEDKIILVKQYRPPLACMTIELPAGLIDEGESAEMAAIRELKEETGYIGKLLSHHLLCAWNQESQMQMPKLCV